jgi:O-antigen/teichoic acid export membrane protein
MSSQTSILKPALIIMCGRLLGYAATFAIPIVLVRLFDQATFGTYKQLFVSFGTVYGIAQLGLNESLYYFVPENARRAGRYVANAVIGLAASGLLCAGLLWLLREEVAAALNNPMLAGTLPLLAVYTVLMMVASAMETVMIGRNRHRLASAAYAASDIARAVLLVLPVLLLPELIWLLVGAVAFAALRCAAMLVYMGSEFRADFRPRAYLVGRQAAYAGPFSIAVLIALVQSQLHMYYISWQFDPATFAIYAIACLQIPVVDFLSQSAVNVLMVRMKELMGKAADAVVGVWNEAIDKLALILFPLVGCLLVVAHELITVLFTLQYAASVPIFMLWTLSILPSVLPADGVLRVYAQMRYLIAANLVRLAVIAALIVPFVNAWGLIGGVAATLAGMVVFKSMALLRIRTLFGASAMSLLPWSRLGRTATLAIVSALPVLALKALVTLPGFAMLAVAGTLYTATYVALVMQFGRLDTADRDALTGWLQRPFGVLARAWRG